MISNNNKTQENKIEIGFIKSFSDYSVNIIIHSSENPAGDTINLNQQQTQEVIKLLNQLVLSKAQPRPSDYVARMSAPKGQNSSAVANYALIKELQRQLTNAFNSWMSGVKNFLISHLNKEYKYYLIIKLPRVNTTELTDEEFNLYYLPFETWDFFDEFSNIFYAFAGIKHEYKKVKTNKNKASMLAIQGDDQNINILKDIQILKKIKGQIHIKAIKYTSQRELNSYLWNEQCEILFYSGHSNTEQKEGRIGDIAVDSITKGFEKLASKGLQIAIFNSCDALGVAIPLQSLNIPLIIIMREQVSDEDAHQFIELFLEYYVKQSKSIYEVIRLTREKLGGDVPKGHLKPCPLVFVNPLLVAPLWKDILPFTRVNIFWTLPAFLTSFALPYYISNLPFIASSEWSIYDLMMWQKALFSEVKQHKQVTVVAIDDPSYQWQQENENKSSNRDKLKGSISDNNLSKLLNILAKSKPKAIVLDLSRDGNKDMDYNSKLFKSIPNLYLTCFPYTVGRKVVPTGFPEDRHLSATLRPFKDGIYREYLPSDDSEANVKKDKQCNPKTTVAIKMASILTKNSNFNQPFFIDFRGFNGYKPRGITTVNLRSIVENEDDLELFKDRVILIGVTRDGLAGEDGDRRITPLGKTYGVYIHAEAITTLLDLHIRYDNKFDGWTSEKSYVYEIFFITLITGVAWFIGTRYRLQCIFIIGFTPVSIAIDTALFFSFGLPPRIIMLVMVSCLSSCTMTSIIYHKTKLHR